jgi:hypothetical protein
LTSYEVNFNRFKSFKWEALKITFENEVLLSPLNPFHLSSLTHNTRREKVKSTWHHSKSEEGVSYMAFNRLNGLYKGNTYIRDKVRCHYIDHWLSCFDSRISWISKVGKLKVCSFVKLHWDYLALLYQKICCLRTFD